MSWGEALLTVERLQGDTPEDFLSELEQVLTELSRATLDDPKTDAILEKIYFLAETCLGSNGAPFLLGLFISVLGEGELAQDVKITASQADIALHYLADHPQLFTKYIQAKKSASTKRMEESI